MDMKRTTIRSPILPAVALALLLAACGGGGGVKATPQVVDDGAWMDGALVKVERDQAAKRQTVTLVDEASGHAEPFDEEALDEGVIEEEDQPLASLLAEGEIR